MDFIRYTGDRICRQRLQGQRQTTTSLNRCLSTFQLTFVGVGSMVGSGIYVLIGVATKDQAGPAVIVSFLLAALSCLFTSFCFAEFGSSIPQSGNPYLYVYTVFGEFLGFLTGWSFAVGYLISGALSARAWSGYLDSLIGNVIQNYTIKIVGKWTFGDPVADHPDFVAAVVLVLFTCIAMTGVQCSASLTNLLAIMNCCVLLVFSVVGILFGSTDNWFNSDHGGFFPYGTIGVMQGTAVSFFAFFGFENICIAAEESKDYSRSVPRALIASILLSATLYIGTAISFTLLVPYYKVDIHAPIANALSYTRLPWLRYALYVGPMCGLSNILLVNGYVFSRLLFSMSEENLMWKGFASVNQRTKVPALSMLICCVIESVIAFFLKLEHLFKFYVIVSIVAFTMISFGIVKLRYNSRNSARDNFSRDSTESNSNSTSHAFRESDRPLFHAPRCSCSDKRFHLSIVQSLVTLCSCLSLNMYLLIISFSSIIVAIMTLRGSPTASAWFSVLVVVVILLVGLSTLAISRFEKRTEHSSFRVPLVPVFPIVTGVINIFFLVSTFDSISLIGYSMVIVSGILTYLMLCYHDMKRGITCASTTPRYSPLQVEVSQSEENL